MAMPLPLMLIAYSNLFSLNSSLLSIVWKDHWYIGAATPVQLNVLEIYLFDSLIHSLEVGDHFSTLWCSRITVFHLSLMYHFSSCFLM